ncbi:MAG: hypothetical protein JWM05_1696 [Acidimicrobiales bacterium]|nr:hypothetical protein [Acidimicrobiales bacterium]
MDVEGGAMALLPPGLPLGPGSVSWRVVREPAVVGAGAGRALLLQVAHPAVAAGVAQHSDYQGDPWGRLFRTLDTMLKLAFAPAEVGARKADLLARRHATVHGRTDDGIPYDARDPDLLRWVWATLVDSSLCGYRRGVGPLSDRDADRFVQENTLIAQACGLPPGDGPTTAAELRRYVDDVVAHDLRVTDTARTVAAQILRPPVPWPVRPIAGASNALVTTALLPPSLRAPLGLPWGPGRARAARAAFAASRAASRVVPAFVRTAPVDHLVRRPRPLGAGAAAG